MSVDARTTIGDCSTDFTTIVSATSAKKIINMPNGHKIGQPTKKRSILAKTKLPTVVLLSFIKTFNVVILISSKDLSIVVGNYKDYFR